LLKEDLVPTASLLPAEGKKGKGRKGGVVQGKRGVVNPRKPRPKNPRKQPIKPTRKGKRRDVQKTRLTKNQLEVMKALYSKNDRATQDAKEKASAILEKIDRKQSMSPEEQQAAAVFSKVVLKKNTPRFSLYRSIVMTMVILAYIIQGANGVLSLNDSVNSAASVDSASSVSLRTESNVPQENAGVNTDEESGEDDKPAAPVAPAVDEESGEDDKPAALVAPAVDEESDEPTAPTAPAAPTADEDDKPAAQADQAAEDDPAEPAPVMSPQVQLWLDTFGQASLDDASMIVHHMKANSPLLQEEASLAVEDDGYDKRETINRYRRQLRAIMSEDEQHAEAARANISTADAVPLMFPYLWLDYPGYPWHDMKLNELYKHYGEILTVFTSNMKSFVSSVGDTRDEKQYMTRLLNPVLSELLVIGTPSNRNVTKASFLLDIMPADEALAGTRQNLEEIRTGEISKMVTATGGGADVTALAKKVGTGLSVQNVVRGAVAKLKQMTAEDWWTEYATQDEPHSVTSFQDGFYDAWREYRPYAIQGLRNFVHLHFDDLQTNVNPQGPTYGQQLAVRGSDASSMAVGRQTSVETETFRQFTNMAHELIAYNTAMEMSKGNVQQDTSGSALARAENMKQGLVQKLKGAGAMSADAIKKIEEMESRELVDFLKESEQANFFAGSMHITLSQSPVDQNIMQYVQQSAMNLKREFDPRHVQSLEVDDEQDKWTYEQLGRIQDAVTHPFKDQELGTLIKHDIPISNMVQKIWSAMDPQNLETLEASRKRLVQAMSKRDSIAATYDEDNKQSFEEGKTEGETNMGWKLFSGALSRIGGVVGTFAEVLLGLFRLSWNHPAVPTTLVGIYAIYKLKEKCVDKGKEMMVSTGKRLMGLGGTSSASSRRNSMNSSRRNSAKTRRKSKSRRARSPPRQMPSRGAAAASIWSAVTGVFNSWKSDEMDLDTMAVKELKKLYRGLRTQIDAESDLSKFDKRVKMQNPSTKNKLISAINEARAELGK